MEGHYGVNSTGSASRAGLSSGLGIDSPVLPPPAPTHKQLGLADS